jgi:hypothetical protein
MKKSVFLSVLFLVTIFPLVAQEEESEETPVEYLTLKRGNIPPAVIKAAEELFKGDTQISYGVFPYQLKDYGWVKDENYNEPIDHYEIHLHTSNGAEVYAVFESTGELIRYRQSLKNASLPVAINNAIAKTEYKDWKLIEDTELIKSSQKKVTDHYSLKLVKGNNKKTLYFNADGTLLNNKR